MNIFYLSHNQEQCAIWHVDKHVVKMIVEYCQLLSTAHRLLDNNLPDYKNELLYKATHINRPSTNWTIASLGNYEWLHGLLVEVNKEYTFRYEKIHKCEWSGLIDMLKEPPANIPDKGFILPPLVMPDIHKTDDVIESYHNLIRDGKTKLHKWKKREIPEFI